MTFSYPQADYEIFPFPHAVIDGAWDDGLIRGCKEHIKTFTDWDGEKQTANARFKRYSSRPTGPCAELIREASSPEFLSWLEMLTGEKQLVADPRLKGGGIHSIKAGGFLNLHVDFNFDAELNLYRRLNVLIYLNHDWQWNGDLELWSRHTGNQEKVIPPVANRMVVFTTDDDSIHGHPEPLECPADVSRDSIALYYYSPIKPVFGWESRRLNTTYFA